MALDTPETATEVIQRAKADVTQELEESNPFLRNSWLSALISGYANRIFDFYYTLTQAEKEALPDTAVINAERWATIWKVLRTAATKAEGNVVLYASNVTGTLVPLGTILVYSDGKEYETTEEVNMPATTIQQFISSLTRSGTTCTANFASPHLLATGVKIVVTGATPPEYNTASWTPITVISATSFTYEVPVAPASSPAGGTPAVLHIAKNISIRSIEFGSDQNLDPGSQLTLQSPLTDVIDTGGVDIDGVGGGTDQESTDDLKARYIDRIQNPIAHFNANEIIAKAKTVAGVTRVFVKECTPAVGQVTVYFMRDNDDNPIPSGTEIDAVEEALEEIRPATSDASDVIVSAPTGVSVDFTFSALSPNTPSMQAAIEANLAVFFADRAQEGENIDADAYRSAIFNTVDTTNGDEVSTFTLSAPTGDITITSGQIGVLGNIAFP